MSAKSASLALPLCPFPPRISPYADEAERAIRGYLRRFGLLRSPEAAEYYDASRLGYLTAQIYPDASRERLLAVTYWFGVWTIFDDQLERLPDSREPEAVDTVAAAMLSWLAAEGPPRAGVPFEAAFGDAWAWIRRHSSPAWQARFVGNTRQYLAGCRWEAENRRRGSVPDLKSYVQRRRRFGGIRMAMDLSEFGGGYELAPHVHADPLIQELLDVLGDLTLWGNDIYSVAVDREEGNVSNLVFVLQAEHGCDQVTATGLVNEMLDGRLARLRQLEEGLPQWFAARGLTADERADVSRYVEGVHTWISGNVTWSLENTRYRGAGRRISGEQTNFLLSLVP
jgi:hypothetical protein